MGVPHHCPSLALLQGWYVQVCALLGCLKYLDPGRMALKSFPPTQRPPVRGMLRKGCALRSPWVNPRQRRGSSHPCLCQPPSPCPSQPASLCPFQPAFLCLCQPASPKAFIPACILLHISASVTLFVPATLTLSIPTSITLSIPAGTTVFPSQHCHCPRASIPASMTLSIPVSITPSAPDRVTPGQPSWTASCHPYQQHHTVPMSQPYPSPAGTDS